MTKRSDLERHQSAAEREIAEEKLRKGKAAAERHNARMTLISNTCGQLGVAVLGATFIVPYFGTAPVNINHSALGLVAAILLLVTAYVVAGFKRFEE